MKILAIYLLRIFLGFILLGNFLFALGQKCDSINVVSTVKEFESSIISNEKVVLRSYQITFNALNQCEIISNQETSCFFDSLANFLNEYPELIVEIGVHLSIRYSEHYSSRYDCMPEKIKRILIERGISSNRLSTMNYLDSAPIVNSNQPKNESKGFWEREIKINKRVEFKTITID